MKFIELNKAWTWALIFGFGALILWIYILLPPSETPSFPLENTTPNEDKVMNETNIVDKNQIPFLERIVMLVKYNKTECPDLQVVHANNTFNITTVKDIEAELNFAIIGRYDTNDPELVDKINQVEFLNTNSCEPDFVFMTHNQFILLLVDYGVPINDGNKTETTETKVAEATETDFQAPFVHDSKYL